MKKVGEQVSKYRSVEFEQYPRVLCIYLLLFPCVDVMLYIYALYLMHYHACILYVFINKIYLFDALSRSVFNELTANVRHVLK